MRKIRRRHFVKILTVERELHMEQTPPALRKADPNNAPEPEENVVKLPMEGV